MFNCTDSEGCGPLHSGLKMIRYSLYLNYVFVAGLLLLGGLQSVLPELTSSELASNLALLFELVMVCGFVLFQPIAVYRVTTGLNLGILYSLLAIAVAIIPLLGLIVLIPLKSRAQEAVNA